MFTSELEVCAVNGARWRLTKPLVWQSGNLDSPDITVPVGFVTDLASIPRAVQALPSFGVNGKSRRAAVLHDYLYECCRLRMAGHSKALADATFREALKAEGVNSVARWMYYKAVSWFGGSSL